MVDITFTSMIYYGLDGANCRRWDFRGTKGDFQVVWCGCCNIYLYDNGTIDIGVVVPWMSY